MSFSKSILALVVAALCCIPSIAAPACAPCLVSCFETAAPCVSAGPAAYAACVAFCDALCAAVCLSPACFSEDSSVHMLGNDRSSAVVEKAAAIVRVGDRVMTGISQDGSASWATVTHVSVHDGDWKFVEVHCANGKKVQVTSDHMMIRMKPMNATKTVCKAGELRVGETLPTADGRGTKITRLRARHRDTKYTIVTSEGLLVTEGVVVTTMCHDETVVNGTTTLDVALRMWKQTHPHFTSDANEN